MGTQEQMNAAAYGTIKDEVDWLREKYDDAGQGVWDTSKYIGSNLLGGINSIGQGAQTIRDYSSKFIADNRVKNPYAKERAQQDKWNEHLNTQNRTTRLHEDMAREPAARERMNAERAGKQLGNFKPQGVASPAAQRYGSENMYNYNSPRPAFESAPLPSANTAATANTASSANTAATAQPGSSFAGQVIADARAQAQAGNAPGLEVSGNYLSATNGADGAPQVENPYGPNSANSSARHAYSNANYRLGMHSPEAQRVIVNDNRAKAAQGKLRVGTDQFGYGDMSPDAYRRMELERMGVGTANKPVPMTQSQKYHADLRGKALPIQDNRPGPYHTQIPEQQTKALGTNVADPLGRQGDSDFNQTSGTQMLNNGNNNNPKSMNNPKANRSNNGFWK